MAHQPRTPAAATSFAVRQPQSGNQWMTPTNARTPISAGSSNNTYLLPVSPMKGRRTSSDSYKPKALRTCGNKPACLVNASLTYSGDNSIYAFGGFDQYTDEGKTLIGQNSSSAYANPLVYNHVLKLDLDSLQWILVDNYGDIPGVRMGMSLMIIIGRSISC